MEFPFGQSVRRERRLQIPSPTNPDATVPGSWDAGVVGLDLIGAYIASSSSIATRDATRIQILTEKSLFLTDPAADVLPGDRVVAAGVVYYVQVRPVADINPFTGWQPVVEIPLENTEG